jgi:hypothetical protein
MATQIMHFCHFSLWLWKVSEMKLLGTQQLTCARPILDKLMRDKQKLPADANFQRGALEFIETRPLVRICTDAQGRALIASRIMCNGFWSEVVVMEMKL